MPRVKAFEILLDTPDKTFISGDNLTGHVRLEIVKKPLELRAVRIKFKGKEEVEWREGKTTFYAQQIYFNLVQTLFGKEVGDKGTNETLPIGQHILPFTYHLPGGLPSTFKFKQGSIRYIVKAKIDRKWKIDNEAKVPFKVMETLDVNSVPELMEPIQLEEMDHFCCCCCKSGEVRALARLDTKGFNLGQTMNIFLEVENNNSNPVKEATIRLVEKVTPSSTGFLGIPKKNKATKAEIKTQIDVPANETKRTDLNFFIPSDIIPTMIQSSVLKIEYKIEISVAMHTFKFPIVIGYMPPAADDSMFAPSVPFSSFSPMTITSQPGATPYPPYPITTPYPPVDASAAYPPSSSGLSASQYPPDPPVQGFGIAMDTLSSAPPSSYEDAAKAKI